MREVSKTIILIDCTWVVMVMVYSTVREWKKSVE
jgi:hypothetical protein